MSLRCFLTVMAFWLLVEMVPLLICLHFGWSEAAQAISYLGIPVCMAFGFWAGFKWPPRRVAR
jgi:hypothetical protein